MSTAGRRPIWARMADRCSKHSKNTSWQAAVGPWSPQLPAEPFFECCERRSAILAQTGRRTGANIAPPTVGLFVPLGRILLVPHPQLPTCLSLDLYPTENAIISHAAMKLCPFAVAAVSRCDGDGKINCSTNSRAIPPRSKLRRQRPAFQHAIAQARWDACSCTDPATVLGSAAQTSRRSTKPCACQRSPGRQLFSTRFPCRRNQMPTYPPASCNHDIARGFLVLDTTMS